MKSPLAGALSAVRADWAPSIEAAARTIAVLVALTFTAGLALGTWTHATSARLGHALARLLAPPVDEVNEHEAPLQVLQQAPVPHPLTTIAEELELLPVSQLRQITGIRSKRCRKRELIALAVAC